MRLSVRSAPPEHYPWLFERVQIAPASDFQAIEAVEESTGLIRGMIGYENWAPNSVQAHIAVDTPIAWRSLLRPAFRFPLEMAGREVILGVIPESNTRSVKLVRHLGFTETHRVKDGWEKGVDLILFEMRKSNCRWLKEGAAHG